MVTPPPPLCFSHSEYTCCLFNSELRFLLEITTCSCRTLSHKKCLNIAYLIKWVKQAFVPAVKNGWPLFKVLFFPLFLSETFASMRSERKGAFLTYIAEQVSTYCTYRTFMYCMCSVVLCGVQYTHARNRDCRKNGLGLSFPFPSLPKYSFVCITYIYGYAPSKCFACLLACCFGGWFISC